MAAKGKTQGPELPSAVFSWFPGHMQKAWRKLQADLKQVDALLLVVDSRIPRSSRHSGLEDFLAEQDLPMLWVLNKSDLAEMDQTMRWLQALKARGHAVVEMQSRQGSGPGPIKPYLQQLQERIAGRRERRNLGERASRLQVVGVPNVGKSSLLNRLVSRSAAKTGKRPGLTRGASQWVAGPEGFMVLDSPGILYPRIENWDQLSGLAACGCVKPEVLPALEVADYLLLRMEKLGHLNRLPLATTELAALGKRMGFLLPRAEIDMERTARWLIASCFEGKFGRITWERVEDE